MNHSLSKINDFRFNNVAYIALKGAQNDVQNEHQNSQISSSKWPQKATLRDARLCCELQGLLSKRLLIETLPSRLNSVQSLIKKATKNRRFLCWKRLLPSTQKVDSVWDVCTKLTRRGASKRRSKNETKMHQKCTPKYINISENMISKYRQKWRICCKTEWKSRFFVCQKCIQNDLKMMSKWHPNSPPKRTKMTSKRC